MMMEVMGQEEKKLFSLHCWKCKVHIGFVKGYAEINCTRCRTFNIINTEALIKKIMSSPAEIAVRAFL